MDALVAEGEMLERLDDIPWANLRHAYGFAVDVPAQIRALASDDEDARLVNLYDLYGNIYHQGTVYEATGYTVPFLTELAQCTDVPDRHQVLKLLKAIAEGRSYLEGQSNFPVLLEYWQDQPDYEENLAAELKWVRAARHALASHLPAYGALLNDSCSEVREAAACLIGALEVSPTDAFPLLQKHLEYEPDLLPAIAGFASIGRFAQEHKGAQNWLRASFSEEKDPAARLAAASAVVTSMGKDAPTDALEFVIAGLDAAQPVKELIEAVCERTDLLCAEALSAAGEAAVPALPALLRVALRRPRHDRQSLVKAMLKIAFGEPHTEPLPPVASLTDPQKWVLRLLAGDEEISNEKDWIDMIVGYHLRCWNLPDTQAGLRAYLAGFRPASDALSYH